MKRRRVLRRLSMALLACLGVYLTLCYLMARALVSPGKVAVRPSPFSEAALYDGTKVWIAEPSPQPRAVAVFVHGLGGTMGHWQDLMDMLLKDGIASITPAMPGHDDSPRSTVGFGPAEAEVVLATSAYARKRWPGRKIVLVGASLGGSAIWLAAKRDPTCADAILTESAFARLSPCVDHWLSRKLGAVGPILLAPMRWMAASMASVDESAVNPIEGARTWRGPTAIFHDAEDQVIQRAQGDELASAVGVPLQLLECPHAHGVSRACGRLREAVLELVRKAG